jgi:hypothetical protein
MTLIQAQARMAELNLKTANGETLTSDERLDLDTANSMIQAAAAIPNRAKIEEQLRSRGLLPTKFGMSPTMKLALTVTSYIGVAALSAFGGSYYERHKGNRGRNGTNTGTVAHAVDHPVSLSNEVGTTSHPAPTTPRTSRSTASA